MSAHAQTPRAFLALSLGLALALIPRATAQLATKSPFLSAAAGSASAPTAGAPLEYRGTMQTTDGLKVRIVDPSRKSAGVWLRVNERDAAFGVVVKQIDVEHDTVAIDYQGQSMTLAQHVAKVVSAGSAQIPPSGAPNPNMPAAIMNTVQLNPTPADEQRRLEAVAAEVARRRQLREQASQTPLSLPQVQQQLQNNNQPNNNGNLRNQQQRGGNQRQRQP